MYYEGFHFVDRSGQFGDQFNDYTPYAEDFGHAPGDTEIADEFLAHTPDPLLGNC